MSRGFKGTCAILAIFVCFIMVFLLCAWISSYREDQETIKATVDALSRMREQIARFPPENRRSEILDPIPYCPVVYRLEHPECLGKTPFQFRPGTRTAKGTELLVHQTRPISKGVWPWSGECRYALTKDLRIIDMMSEE